MVPIIIAVLIAILHSNVYADCVVNQDCVFEYTPTLILDGYSRDTSGGLTLVAVDEIDLRYAYSDDLTQIYAIAEGDQSDSCGTVPASGVCMFHSGNGWYRIVVDSLLIPSSKAGKRLCLDIQDVQGTRTVGDDRQCQDVVGGGTVWDTYEIVDLTNDGGDQNPTTTSSDTNLTWTVNFSSTTPQPVMYYPTVNEDARQSTNCNLQGFRTEITAYNTSTKVITYRAVPAAPDYRCIFRVY